MATPFSDAWKAASRASAFPHGGHVRRSQRLFAPARRPGAGFNGHARERAIVMHGAPVRERGGVRSANGRLGRSWGCPALREAIARQVIDTVRGGGVIFSYYPDETWLKTPSSQLRSLPRHPRPSRRTNV
jgi:hypothetical protein